MNKSENNVHLEFKKSQQYLRCHDESVTECEQLEKGIAALEAQRAILGHDVVDIMISAAQEKLYTLNIGQTPIPFLGEPKSADLQGQSKRVTAIIVDVKHSTELLEHLGTEMWVGLMNRTFHVLETVIYDFGGEVDQFRGDGLVAFFWC